MQFTQAEELMTHMKEQNLFLSRIAIALEQLIEYKRKEVFVKQFEQLSNADLAGK